MKMYPNGYFKAIIWTRNIEWTELKRHWKPQRTEEHVIKFNFWTSNETTMKRSHFDIHRGLRFCLLFANHFFFVYRYSCHQCANKNVVFSLRDKKKVCGFLDPISFKTMKSAFAHTNWLNELFLQSNLSFT